ncbi:hypothetical protein HPB50_027794 [Hyalomma asiaticum]|nr:hypothetical protein HPB50_027794 [Hyalomma asiaticum]
MDKAIESQFFTAMKRMNNGDDSLFFQFYRMTPDTFNLLHSMVQEHLTKEKCPSREPSWRAPGAHSADTHSIVLMAIADSLFHVIDVGAPGRFSDGETLKDSPIGHRLRQGKLDPPGAEMLHGSKFALMYFSAMRPSSCAQTS